MKQSDPDFPMCVHVFFEYREAKEGYWTGDKFAEQMKKALHFAELKYPKVDGWRHAWVFDYSSCHATIVADALNASEMNVKRGGKHQVMHDTLWQKRFRR